MNTKKGFLNLLLVLVIFVSISINTLAVSQPRTSPLKGYDVVYKLSEEGMSPQKAFNGINNMEQLINGSVVLNNIPQLLYTIAKYKIYLGDKHQEFKYAQDRPDDYYYAEIQNSYMYKGNELKKIIDDYPASPIADDAAYMLATLPQGGECEGDVYCYFSSTYYRFVPFIKKSQHSPYINNVIEDINESLKPLVEHSEPGNYPFYDEENKQMMLKSLNDYYVVLTEMSDPAKIDGLYMLALSYNRAGDKTKCKKILQEIILNYPDYAGINKVKRDFSSLSK